MESPSPLGPSSLPLTLSQDSLNIVSSSVLTSAGHPWILSENNYARFPSTPYFPPHPLPAVFSSIPSSSKVDLFLLNSILWSTQRPAILEACSHQGSTGESPNPIPFLLAPPEKHSRELLLYCLLFYVLRHSSAWFSGVLLPSRTCPLLQQAQQLWGLPCPLCPISTGPHLYWKSWRPAETWDIQRPVAISDYLKPSVTTNSACNSGSLLPLRTNNSPCNLSGLLPSDYQLYPYPWSPAALGDIQVCQHQRLRAFLIHKLSLCYVGMLAVYKWDLNMLITINLMFYTWKLLYKIIYLMKNRRKMDTD
jgi:hypothetical protein